MKRKKRETESRTSESQKHLSMSGLDSSLLQIFPRGEEARIEKEP